MVKRGISPEQAKKIRESKGIEDTKLQKMRLKKNLSQKQLAAITGVSWRAIQSYEQRVRPIESARLDSLCSICIALNCKIEDILEDERMIERHRLVK